MPFTSVIELAVRVIELAGVFLIVAGFIIASVRYAMKFGNDQAFRGYRQDLGRAILLGLEVLVAADIIGTVTVDLNITSVLALGLIVLIRTFLSWSLEVELEGRWPWQRKAEDAGTR